MSKAEDDSIQATMNAHSSWQWQFHDICHETLDEWAKFHQLRLNKYALAIELMQDCPFFYGNDAAFDPQSDIHRDYLLHWCQKWIDKRKLDA